MIRQSVAIQNLREKKEIILWLWFSIPFLNCFFFPMDLLIWISKVLWTWQARHKSTATLMLSWQFSPTILELLIMMLEKQNKKTKTWFWYYKNKSTTYSQPPPTLLRDKIQNNTTKSYEAKNCELNKAKYGCSQPSQVTKHYPRNNIIYIYTYIVLSKLRVVGLFKVDNFDEMHYVEKWGKRVVLFR